MFVFCVSTVKLSRVGPIGTRFRGSRTLLGPQFSPDLVQNPAKTVAELDPSTF